MEDKNVNEAPTFLKVIAICLGIFAIYISVTLGVDGQFTFKGAYYSNVETPILFWMHVVGFFIIGTICIALSLVTNKL